MRYRPLGKTKVNVSEIGFGAWSIGGKDYGPTDDKTSLAALRRAYDLGITFFDTADMYGDGRSEQLIASALKNHYHKIFVATKVGHNFYEGDYRKEFGSAYIFFAADESLKRLSTECIDLLQLHNPSPEVLRKGEVFEALEALVQKGKIRFWGVSVGSVEAAQLSMSAGTATLQLVHNLLRPDLLHSIHREVEQNGIGIIARTPLEYGLLSGKYRNGDTFHETDHRAKRWTPQAFSKRLTEVESFRFLVKGNIKTLSEGAIRYILSSPLVSVVIPGIKFSHQLEEILKAIEGEAYLEQKDLSCIADSQTILSPPA